MAVVLNKLSGNTGGLKINTLSLPYVERTLGEQDYELEYELQKDCFYLIYANFSDILKIYALGYIPSNIEDVPNRMPFTTISTSPTKSYSIQFIYDSTSHKFTIDDEDGGTDMLIDNSTWRFYKIPLSVNFNSLINK